MKEKYGLIKENIIKQEKANDFMGIKIDNGIPKIYVPLSFRISEDYKERNRDIAAFLKSISIAFKDKEYIKQNFGKIGEQWPIDSYLWLIKDYFENGFYNNREKEYKRGNFGRINWKRTIKNMPIISNSNLIYTDVVTEKISSKDDAIAFAYRYCLSVSLKRMGWYYNTTANIKLKNILTKKEMITEVKNSLYSTFDDLKRLRYKHMLAVLSCLNETNDNSKAIFFGVRNYYYVYEKMIDSYFGGINSNELKKYFPHGIWHLLPDLNKNIYSSELRPDSIKHFEDGRKYTFIIDAKMYKFGGLEKIEYDGQGLPDTSSIQKQITYGEFVQKYVDRDRIVKNIFIIPFNKMLKRYTNDSLLYKVDNNIVYIGYAEGDWRNNNISSDMVYSFLIDFNYLLHNYKKRIDNETFLKILNCCED